MPLVLGLVVRAAAASSRGRRRPWISFLGAIGFLAALLLAAAFWIRTQGVPMQGVIAGKNESLTIDDTGLNPSVLRRFTLTVADDETQARFAHLPTGNRVLLHDHVLLNGHVPMRSELPMSGDLEIDIDEPHFDALREGQSVAMHEWTFGPLKVARLDLMPWWDLAPGLFDRIGDAFGWESGSGGPNLRAEADVVSVRTVRDAYPISLLGGGSTGGVHVILEQPYDEIRLHVHTAQGVDALALDRVDTGSSGMLTPGTLVPVTYAVDRPRMTRVVTGTRSYRRRNALNYWSGECITVAVFIAVIVAVYAVRRRWRLSRTA